MPEWYEQNTDKTRRMPTGPTPSGPSSRHGNDHPDQPFQADWFDRQSDNPTRTRTAPPVGGGVSSPPAPPTARTAGAFDPPPPAPPTPGNGPGPRPSGPAPGQGLAALLVAGTLTVMLVLAGVALLTRGNDGDGGSTGGGEQAADDADRSSDRDDGSTRDSGSDRADGSTRDSDSNRDDDAGSNSEETTERGDGDGDDDRADEERAEPPVEEEPAPAVGFQPGEYRTAELLQIEQLSGKPEWAANGRNRIEGAVWTFSADGTFRYAPPDSRDDLFPTAGFWSDDNGVIRFEAQSRSVTTVGSAETLIYGRIRQAEGGPEVEATWITTSGLAAVVGGTEFASANGSAYEFTVRLG